MNTLKAVLYFQETNISDFNVKRGKRTGCYNIYFTEIFSGSLLCMHKKPLEMYFYTCTMQGNYL